MMRMLLLGLLLLLLEQLSTASRDKGKRQKLLHPSVLLIPGIYDKMRRRGLIVNDHKPDQRWIVQHIDQRDDYYHYCPEVVYATLVLDREPSVMFHRVCNSTNLWEDNPHTQQCLSNSANSFINTCRNQISYQIVTIRGIEKYQEIHVGCACIATGRTSQ